MGQFKPMVKMMTTEPSVELKLKKGGAVKMMNGGVMGGLAAAPSAAPARGGMMPAARPKKPGMAARRAAMMGRPMKEGGESAAEHKAEMKTMAATAKKLEQHKSMPASKAHKGLKTGGVVMGQAGFKEGGVIKSTKGETKMVTAQGGSHTSKKTGEVVMGKPAGYKKGGKAMGGCYAKGGGVEGNVSTSKPGKTNTTTGEVKKGNAGGYKKGGKAKKMADGGYAVPSEKGMSAKTGSTTPTPALSPREIEASIAATNPYREPPRPRPETPPPTPPIPTVPQRTVASEMAMPKRRAPVMPRRGSMSMMKEGGSAKKAFAAGGSVNDSGRPVAYPKKPASQPIKNTKQSGTFRHGGGVKMNKGGIPAEAQSAIKQADAERAYRDYEKAEKAENEAMRETILGAPGRMLRAVKGMFKGDEKPAGSVTKTEKSVTVAPAKKRGGSVKC